MKPLERAAYIPIAKARGFTPRFGKEETKGFISMPKPVSDNGTQYVPPSKQDICSLCVLFYLQDWRYDEAAKEVGESWIL